MRAEPAVAWALAAVVLSLAGCGESSISVGPAATGCAPKPCMVSPDGLSIRIGQVVALSAADLQPLADAEGRASFLRSCASPPPLPDPSKWRRQAGCDAWGIAVPTSFSWDGEGTKVVRGSDFRVLDERLGRAFLPLLLCGVAADVVDRHGCFRDSPPLAKGGRHEPGALYFNLAGDEQRDARLILRYVGAGTGVEIPLPLP